MISEPGAGRLLSLSDEEITDLFQVVPGLADTWSEMVGTDARQLERAHPQALTALRAALVIRGGQLLSLLARAGLEHIRATLEEPEFGEDEAAGPLQLAVAAGEVLGSAAGCLFLAAVAEGTDSIRTGVASRMAELQDIVRSSGVSVRPETPGKGEIAGPAADGQSIQALAERTRHLRDLGAALAGTLRVAADDVEAGQPVTRVGGDLIRWSAAVRQHLSEAEEAAVASDLADLAAKLSELALQSRAHDRRLQDALRGARLLYEQGLGHLVPGMLQAVGFDSPGGPPDVRPEAVMEVSEPEPNAESADRADPGSHIAEAPRLIAPAADEILAAFHDLDSPWDLGTPPLLATLISEQRYALAVCVAGAAEENSARQRLLRFFCAAYSCSPAALELQLADLSLPSAEVGQMRPDECRVLLAAALRAALVIGYSPVDLPSLLEQAELEHASIRVAAEAAVEAVRRGHRWETRTAMARQSDLVREWAAFASEAQRLQKSLAQRTIDRQRASSVLHWLVWADGPVGGVLALVAGLAAAGASASAVDARNERWDRVERLAADLSDPAARTRLITVADQAVSAGQLPLKPIIGSTRIKLDDSLLDVSDLLMRFLAVRSALRLSAKQADLQTADELSRAIDRLPGEGEVTSVGDSALRQLTGWLRSATPAADAASIEDLIRVEVEPLYEIPRDKEGYPARPPNLTEVRELLRGRDRLEVMRGYLATGNVAAAQRIVATADDLEEAALDDEIAQGRRDSRSRHQQALEAVDRAAARLRAVYRDDAARELSERAGQFRVAPDDRFDLTIGPLRDLASAGEAQLRSFRDDLRQRTFGLPGDDTDRQRILELIEREDEVLAVEFLTMAEAGHYLPVVNEQHGDDFSSFFPAMVTAALPASGVGGDVVEAVRVAAGATADPQNRQLAAGLEAWRELKTERRGSSNEKFRLLVANVLRMLGLVPRPQKWLQELSRTQRSGFATFKIRAAPLDRSYVPSLGTQAGQTYDLTLVWDAVTPMRLMDFIEESRRTQANIILYFNTLEPAHRLMLRRLTRYNGGKGFSPVVIDEPVIAWLSTRPDPGWRFTQRVTLPFTTINPYTPFAAGEVPDEVFVGREAERQAIEDPTGSMFVYGGRQLGKSALLRRVERLFTEPVPAQQKGARTGHVAVYLDLKAASIGEAQEPAALWTVLAQRLADSGVLSPHPGRAAAPDEVIQQVTHWLNSDDGNRLLVLLDEADNFLTADAQAGRGEMGGEFPTLQRLVGLMAASGRRFKAVLAGLHLVQRFHDSSNTPVAHGGDDILVGPLGSLDAYHLVVDPMNALGYTFESPDLVWRLLLLTNYQASLVQILCEALVRELSRRDLPEGGGRIVVTGGDVELVYAKREVRDLIVQRFRWTINLDSRYQVIALVVALQSLDSDPGDTFTTGELHEYCELYWPKGFALGVLSDKEFERYLNEMVGLGVLHRQGDLYGLRSPNIISLLGDRSSLTRELDEAPRHLELQYEYNPTMNRRNLGHATELGARRSPLSDQDIASLLGQDGARGARVKIVTGSQALAIDRAARVIQDVAVEQQIPCDLVAAGDIKGAIGRARTRCHLIVDLSGDDVPQAELAALCVMLAARDHVTATVIVGPSLLPLARELTQPGTVISARRWSIEGLRSWYESPFNSPDLRKRLYRATSGWPLLVESTMLEIDRGKSPDDALAWIVRQLSDPASASAHLAACGIDLEVAARWAAALALPGDDGLVEAFPAGLVELAEVLGTGTHEVIERLRALDVVESTADGWVLDRVVVAAAVASRSGRARGT